MNNLITDAESGIATVDTLPKREDISFKQHNPSQATTKQVPNNHVTIQAAMKISGYSVQYLRRLLRAGKLEGRRIGQTWQIDPDSLTIYLYTAISSNDMRYGPHKAWQQPF